MKPGKPFQEIVRRLLGLVIVAAVTIAIISTLHVPTPGSATAAVSPAPTSSPQQPAIPPQEPTVEAAYPAPGSSALPPAPALSTPVPPEVKILQAYSEELKGNNLSDVLRHSLQTKVAIYSRIVTQRAMITATVDVKVFPTPQPVTDVPLPTGLFEGGSSDFHTWEAVIQNYWEQYVNNNEHVLIYAGELGSETDYPGRGVVFVLRRTPDKRVSSFNRYLLPEGTGWVRISEIKGDYLVLTSKEGKTFYFYVPGQQLVPSLNDIVPTVTPLPTAGPYPTLGFPATNPPSPYLGP
jgi:hypothetical protein